MTLEEAIAEVKERYAKNAEYGPFDPSTDYDEIIFDAVASGDLIPASDAQISGAREVKPLEWKEYPDQGFWRADTVIGEYSVGFDDGWWAQLEGVEFWNWEPPEDPRSYLGPSAGMLACQADYTARILSVLKGAKP